MKLMAAESSEAADGGRIDGGKTEARYGAEKRYEKLRSVEMLLTAHIICGPLKGLYAELM